MQINNSLLKQAKEISFNLVIGTKRGTVILHNKPDLELSLSERAQPRLLEVDNKS